MRIEVSGRETTTEELDENAHQALHDQGATPAERGMAAAIMALCDKLKEVTDAPPQEESRGSHDRL